MMADQGFNVLIDIRNGSMLDLGAECYSDIFSLPINGLSYSGLSFIYDVRLVDV